MATYFIISVLAGAPGSQSFPTPGSVFRLASELRVLSALLPPPSPPLSLLSVFMTASLSLSSPFSSSFLPVSVCLSPSSFHVNQRAMNQTDVSERLPVSTLRHRAGWGAPPSLLSPLQSRPPRNCSQSQNKPLVVSELRTAFHYEILKTWLLIKQFAPTGWFEIKMVIILQMTVTVFHKCGDV